jgi:uncharacterized protein with FMN-binding domain
MKKKLMIGFGVLMFFSIVFGAAIYIRINNSSDFILSQDIRNLSFDDYNDGHYEGEFYHEGIGIQVMFEINDGHIEDLVYENHLNGKGQPAESISDYIIEKQSIIVDDIAGATISSRCIKLAIINALEGESNE